MATVVLKFIKTEAGGGFLLVFAAAAAIVVANSPWSAAYFNALQTPATLDLGVWRVEATLKDWVKDGLLAVFFYVVGLELKRELSIGELSNPKNVVLPVCAAIGGGIVPVAVYFMLAGSAEPRGWPVPVATDIAFALAALAILVPKLDPRLRLFLLTLAVVDDLLAIILIAVLYTADLSIVPLAAALAILAIAALLGRRHAVPIWVYPLLALGTWGLALASGVHTSVMAVAAALVVPPRPVHHDVTLLGRLEHYIHPVSAYVVLPIFAFCAAGISMAGLDLAAVSAGVPLAVAMALALGKPVGVTAFTFAAARIARVPLPFPTRHLIGMGCLCGIGFTMSLFIGALAFSGDGAAEAQARLGVILGSTLSLGLAAAVFRLWPQKTLQLSS